MTIGRWAPTRCPCCGGANLTDGPLSTRGEWGCWDCGADNISGPALYPEPERKRSNVIHLDERRKRFSPPFEPVPNQVMGLFFDDAEGAP